MKSCYFVSSLRSLIARSTSCPSRSSLAQILTAPFLLTTEVAKLISARFLTFAPQIIITTHANSFSTPPY